MRLPTPSQPVGRRFRRGAYLLPSLFTLGNIFLGFYALVRGFRGDFPQAALLIFVAGVIDALDGRIARLTHTESDFGKEFDSLADVLTFGLCPAFLAFLWGLSELGRIGWLIPLFFLSCTAVRLARFNIKTGDSDSRHFVGLPSPAAAGSIASVFFLAPVHSAHPWLAGLMILALISVGLLMVSTFRYPSFKKVDLRKRWSYRAAIPLVILLLLLASHPSAFFLSAALVYTSLGPLGWLAGRLRRNKPETEIDEEARETS